MDEKTIKNNIFRRHRTLSISQTEIAERLGIDRNTYRNIESGGTRMFNCHLEDIARVLEVSLEELLLGPRTGAAENDSRLRESVTWYSSRLDTVTQEYEGKLAEAAGKILSLEKRISELEAILQDKCEIITFLRERVGSPAGNGGN